MPLAAVVVVVAVAAVVAAVAAAAAAAVRDEEAEGRGLCEELRILHLISGTERSWRNGNQALPIPDIFVSDEDSLG